MKSSVSAYKKAYRKKKTMFAHILDNCLGTVILYFAICFLLREIGASRASAYLSAVLITAASVIIISLVKERRFEKFMRTEREKVKKDIAARRIMMMTDEEFRDFSEDKIPHEPDTEMIIHRTHGKMDIDTLFSIYRQAKSCGITRLSIVTVTGMEEDAVSSLDHINDMDIKTVSMSDDILTYCAVSDDEADAEYMSRAQTSEKSQKKWKEAAPSRYLICGIVLWGMSFVLKFSLYYRVMGGFCIWLWAFGKFIRKDSQST